MIALPSPRSFNSRALVLLTVLMLPTMAAAQSRLENGTAGVSLAPPSGWHVVSMEEVLRNRSQVRLSDRELEAGLQRAATPLFVISKYEEPYPSLNPTVQIVVRPTPASLDTSPTAMLRAATLTMQKAFSDFVFVEPVQEAQVSGMNAAYMKATYTLKTVDGRQHQILSRTWLVPRGAFMFLIGMSGATMGPDVAEAEFAAALRSIEIQK